MEALVNVGYSILGELIGTQSRWLLGVDVRLLVSVP